MNPKNLSSTRICLALLILTIAGPFINFWGWDLWAPDEPRYAEVAREMVEGNEWLVPHLAGKVYSEKPPLYFWMIAASYLVFGINTFAVRIIPVLSASGTVLITYFIGKKLFSKGAGLLSAMALSTSLLFMHLARRGNIDSTLTLMITAALALIATAYFEDKRRLYLPAYLIMSLGVLLKGPVAFLLPLLALIFYMIAIKDAKNIRRAHLPWALLILIVVVAGWLAPAAITGGLDYFKTIFFRQNLGRVVSSFSHRKPIYYYLKEFPPNFFPWIFFFPQALYFSIRSKTRQSLFPVVWFVAIFLFFSLLSGKRGLYLLPLFPAAALIVGAYFNDCLEKKTFGQSLRVSALLLGIVLAGAGLIPWFIHWFQGIPDYVRDLLKWRPLLTVVLGAGGVLLLSAALRRKYSKIFPIVFMIMFVIGVLVSVLIFPAANRFKTARFICEDLLRERKNDEQVILFRDMTHTGAYHFYTRLALIDLSEEPPIDFSSEDKFLYHEEKLNKLLETDDKTYVIISRENYDKLKPGSRENWRRISSRQVGHRSMMLFATGGGNE